MFLAVATLALFASAQKICPRCPGVYAVDCNGLLDRKTCLSAAEARVQHHENPGKSCTMEITCPRGTAAFLFDGVVKNYLMYAGNPIQCVDRGRGGPHSSWSTELDGGFTSDFEFITCFTDFS
ncbi:hypothetical protein OESDEN_09973 [Oesophagostomum dentatum]|uniref:C6 domain-containing protein n=1 Tax=Oesophagostomum dentatum TaxID=61180 RepID=A0A0B1SY45_OESDE|nr:hypothetical protein OESDEN_09973 [Oesophagostomum dentatum]